MTSIPRIIDEEFHSLPNLPLLSLPPSQTVGVIQLERGSASFTRIIPCRGSNAIFCLHDNGVISLRARSSAPRETSPADDGAAQIAKEDSAVEMMYETLCVSGENLDLTGLFCDSLWRHVLVRTLSLRI